MLRLTPQELILLECIDTKFKYIARDKNGTLVVYGNKPKHVPQYLAYMPSDPLHVDADIIEIYEHLFKGITYENSPLYIDDLIGHLR